MICWRLYDEKLVDNPFGGVGSAKYGGRWNSSGLRAVYCANTLSLAVLEILAHAEDRSNLGREVFRAVEVEVPDRLIETPRELPEDWNQIPSPASARQLGDRFLREGAALALRLPSVIVPLEPNFLLNPLHPEFGLIARRESITFRFDGRLLSP